MEFKYDCIVNLTGEKDGWIVETDGNDWYLGGKHEVCIMTERGSKWITSRNGGTYEKLPEHATKVVQC